jgi:hypothetical protein
MGSFHEMAVDEGMLRVTAAARLLDHGLAGEMDLAQAALAAQALLEAAVRCMPSEPAEPPYRPRRDWIGHIEQGQAKPRSPSSE